MRILYGRVFRGDRVVIDANHGTLSFTTPDHKGEVAQVLRI